MKEDIAKSGVVTNKQFSATDEVFKKCCKMANIEPTGRQASKFCNRQGKAYKERGRVSD